MDVNQVRFGNYSIGSQGAKTRQNESKLDEKPQTSQQANVAAESSPEGVMNALNIAGMQNLAQVKHVNAKEVNPADHLSQERIADIEAMMANFEIGVNEVVDVLEDEFPGMLSDEKKMALAAQIFAQE